LGRDDPDHSPGWVIADSKLVAEGIAAWPETLDHHRVYDRHLRFAPVFVG
jgi:hypothetical protein